MTRVIIILFYLALGLASLRKRGLVPEVVPAIGWMVVIAILMAEMTYNVFWGEGGGG